MQADRPSDTNVGQCELRVIGLPVTFIRAFESSPVHCLNPLPSGKRRRPANGGVIETLRHIKNFPRCGDSDEMLTGGQCHQEYD